MAQRVQTDVLQAGLLRGHVEGTQSVAGVAGLAQVGGEDEPGLSSVLYRRMVGTPGVTSFGMAPALLPSDGAARGPKAVRLVCGVGP